jgi:hypothetical protein
VTNQDRTWIEGHFESLRREVVKVQVDIAMLKVKAGVWGVLGGVATVAVAVGLYAISKWGS